VKGDYNEHAGPLPGTPMHSVLSMNFFGPASRQGRREGDPVGSCAQSAGTGAVKPHDRPVTSIKEVDV
jgi:hypothetical protein